jgi:hypothetical protein
MQDTRSDATQIIISLSARAAAVSGIGSPGSGNKEALACFEKALAMTAQNSSWFCDNLRSPFSAKEGGLQEQQERRVALRCLVLGTFAEYSLTRGDIRTALAQFTESISIGQNNPLVELVPEPLLSEHFQTRGIEGKHKNQAVKQREQEQMQVYCNTRIPHMLTSASCFCDLASRGSSDDHNNGHSEALKLLIQALHLTQKQLQQVHSRFNPSKASSAEANNGNGKSNFNNSDSNKQKLMLAHLVTGLTLQLLVVYFNIGVQVGVLTFLSCHLGIFLLF